MKIIPLTKGQITVVDDADFEWLSQYEWCATVSYKMYYAVRASPRPMGVGKKENLRMHRIIMGAEKGQIVDHRDRNSLNNQRSNLRFATTALNMTNSRHFSSNTSGFRGVCWHERHKKWLASIQSQGRSIHLGCFTDKIEAARRYDVEAVKLFGEFASTNERLGLLAA